MKIIGDIMTSLFPIFRYDYRKQRMSFHFLILVGLLFVSVSGFGQASISGKVVDIDTGEEMQSGEVYVYKDEFLITSTRLDINGFYSISNLDAGNYEILLKNVGSIDTEYLDVIILNDNCTILDVEVYNHYALIQPQIIRYRQPLINLEDFSSGQTFTSEQIRNLPNKN